MNVILPENVLGDLTSENLPAVLKERFITGRLENLRAEEFSFDHAITEQGVQQEVPRDQALQRLMAVIRSSADVNCRVLIRYANQWEIINGNDIQHYTDEQLRRNVNCNWRVLWYNISL